MKCLFFLEIHYGFDTSIWTKIGTCSPSLKNGEIVKTLCRTDNYNLKVALVWSCPFSKEGLWLKIILEELNFEGDKKCDYVEALDAFNKEDWKCVHLSDASGGQPIGEYPKRQIIHYIYELKLELNEYGHSVNVERNYA